MGIIAANIIVGSTVVISTPDRVPRTSEGSFLSLRVKAYSQVKQQLPTQDVLEKLPTIEDVPPSPPPKKNREVDKTLIQYKESAFLSDMLSSSKD